MADSSKKNSPSNDETDGNKEPMEETTSGVGQDMLENSKQQNKKSNETGTVLTKEDVSVNHQKTDQNSDHQSSSMNSEPMDERPSVSTQDSESQKVITDLSEPMEAISSLVASGNSVASSSKDQSVENESDNESSKRQRLIDGLPNTSTKGSESNGCQKASDFRKFLSKFKSRNYRNQSSSGDLMEEASEPPIAVDGHESSSSSQSQNFNIREDLADSSDQRSEPDGENHDSNDYSSVSDDDTDEMASVLLKEPSKSDWNILKDVVNRQIGFNNYVPQRFYGSLHAVQRLELMYKLEEHTGCVNALGFNQNGNYLASASDDLLVTIWDWAVGRKLVALQSGHRSNVFQSKWMPQDENLVVSCARDGQVRLIDIQNKITRKVAQHKAACHKVSTHPELPSIILSAGEDAKVLCIDTRDRKPTKLLNVTGDRDKAVELYSIHSNPLNSSEFCVAGRMRTVRIYDRRKPLYPLHELCPQHLLTEDLAHVTCAVYNHNGTEVIASYNNEDIYLFDSTSSYQTGEFAHKYQGHRNNATVKGVNFFGPNSEFILSGSDCGNIFIWDKKTEAIVQWMAGDEQGIVNALEPHPHFPILATSGLDYDVKIWIPSREETPDIKPQLQSCIKRNLAARSKNAEEAESAFAGHVLWIVLRHARQAERRRNRTRRRREHLHRNVSSDDDSLGNRRDDDDEVDFLDDYTSSSDDLPTNSDSS